MDNYPKFIGVSDDGLLLSAEGDVYMLTEGYMDGYFSADGYYNARGRGLKKLGKWIGKGAKKVGKGIKKVGQGALKVFKKGALAVPRSAFLVLVSQNVFGMASEYNDWKVNNPTKWDKLLSTWEKKLGGNKSALINKIDKGKNRPIKLNKKKKAKFKKANGDEIDGFYNVVGTASVAAGVATAAPIIAIIAQIVGKPKGMDDDELAEINNDAENLQGEQSFFAKYKWYLIGGGVLVLGGLALLLLKKNKTVTQ